MGLEHPLNRAESSWVSPSEWGWVGLRGVEWGWVVPGKGGKVEWGCVVPGRKWACIGVQLKYSTNSQSEEEVGLNGAEWGGGVAWG